MTLFSTGCGGDPSENSNGPALQPLAIVASGNVNGAPWRVALVRQAGSFCTVPQLRGKIVGMSCPPESGLGLPLNFAVDGTREVIVVHGFVGLSVASLTATNDGGVPEKVELRSEGIDPKHRYFAYAVRPGTAKDIVARAANGAIIVSEAAKLSDSQSLGP